VTSNSQVHRLDRPQLTFAIVSAVAAVITAALVLLDDRVLLGAPLWMKPFKFFISATLMSLTLAYVIPRISQKSKRVQIASLTIIGSLAVELVLITWAAASETTSHFNVSSPLAIAVWSAMATFIGLVWVATMVLTLAYVRFGQDEAAMKRALSWGMAISIVGMAVAFFMTGPNSDQLASFEGIAGAHTVGAADGGPGLPLFGWSTVAGDLRIAHFFGLHALQAIPLGVLLLRKNITIRGIDAIGLGYLILVGLLTAQALMGQSIVETSTGFAIAIAVAVVLPVVGALIQGRAAKVRS
jgi:hypothetical protein